MSGAKSVVQLLQTHVFAADLLKLLVKRHFKMDLRKQTVFRDCERVSSTKNNIQSTDRLAMENNCKQSIEGSVTCDLQ